MKEEFFEWLNRKFSLFIHKRRRNKRLNFNLKKIKYRNKQK